MNILLMFLVDIRLLLTCTRQTLCRRLSISEYCP